jgi:hypothetical protein
MTIFSRSGLDGSRQPLLNAQTFALEQLVCIHGATFDLRWAMIELVVRSFTAACAMARRRFARKIKRRQNGCRDTADTMVAAAGR